jgi:hypothetical protein
MQINFLDNLPNSPSDSTTARSIERDDHKSTSPFFVQIDQACNLQDQSSRIPPVKKPVEQVSTPPGNEKRDPPSVGSPPYEKSSRTEKIQKPNTVRTGFHVLNENSIGKEHNQAEAPLGNENRDPLSADSLLYTKSSHAEIIQRANTTRSGSHVLEENSPESVDSQTLKMVKSALTLSATLEVFDSPASVSGHPQSETPGDVNTPAEVSPDIRRSVEPDERMVGKAETIDTAILGAEKDIIQTGNMQNVENFSVDTQAFAPATGVDLSGEVHNWASKTHSSQTAVYHRSELRSFGNSTPFPTIEPLRRSGNPGFSGDLELMEDSDLQGESSGTAIAGKLEEAVHTDRKYANTLDPHPDQAVSGNIPISWKTQQSAPESAQLKFGASPTIPAQSRLSMLFQSESSFTTENPGPIGNYQISEDADGKMESSQAPVAKKLESTAPAVLGDPNADNSAVGKDSIPGGSSSWTVLQNKWDGSQPIPDRRSVPYLDRQLETMTQAASGTVRTQESGVSQDTDDFTGGKDSRPENSGSWTIPQSKWDSSQPIPGRPQAPFADHRLEISPQLATGTVRTQDSGITQTSGPGHPSAAQPKEFLFQLAEQIQVQVRNGRSEIRIQLKPESLGRLEIRAETTSTGVVARITAESSNVKTYLENNLPFLHQALQNQGLRIDRVHIVVQGGFDFQTSSGFNAQFGHTGSGHNGEGTSESTKISGFPASDQPEEISVDPATWIALNPNISFHTIA